MYSYSFLYVLALSVDHILKGEVQTLECLLAYFSSFQVTLCSIKIYSSSLELYFRLSGLLVGILGRMAHSWTYGMGREWFLFLI